MPPQHDCKDFENFRSASGKEAEIKRLREQVAELEGTTTTEERPRVRRRVSRRVHPIDAKF